MDFIAPVGSNDPASWVNGDRATGIKGSQVPHEAFTHSNSEVVNAIIALGKTPDTNQLDQLAQALQEKFADELSIISEDIVYVVGSLPSDFLTMQAAHDSLDSTILVPGVTVTFQMKDEIHAYVSAVVFNHPQARQIQIVAASIPASRPSVGGMAFGSTWPSLYNNRISDNSVNKTYLQSFYPCRIVFAGGGLVFKTGVKLIKDILIEADAASNTVTVQDGFANFENLSIIDGATGILGSHSTIVGKDIFISGPTGAGVSLQSCHFQITAEDL